MIFFKINKLINKTLKRILFSSLEKKENLAGFPDNLKRKEKK